MISYAFVNSTSPSISEMTFLDMMIENANREVDDAVNNVQLLFMESEWGEEIFSEGKDNKGEEVKKASGNAFSKIGDAVISIFKKVQEIIAKFIQSIKDFSFRHKKMEDKLEEIKKVDPTKADKLMVEIEKGNVNVNDLRSYADIQKAYDEIVELCKKKQIDPDSLQGKVEALKEKIKKADQSTIAKGAATAMGIGAAIAFFAKIRADVGKTNLDFQKQTLENRKKFLEAYEALRKENPGAVNPADLRYGQILSNITNYMNGHASRIVTRNTRHVDSIGDKIMSALDNVSLPGSKSNKEKVRGLNYDLRGLNAIKQRQVDEEISKTNKITKDTSKAARKAEIKKQRAIASDKDINDAKLDSELKKQRKLASDKDLNDAKNKQELSKQRALTSDKDLNDAKIKQELDKQRKLASDKDLNKAKNEQEIAKQLALASNTNLNNAKTKQAIDKKLAELKDDRIRSAEDVKTIKSLQNKALSDAEVDKQIYQRDRRDQQTQSNNNP